MIEDLAFRTLPEKSDSQDQSLRDDGTSPHNFSSSSKSPKYLPNTISACIDTVSSRLLVYPTSNVQRKGIRRMVQEYSET